MGACRQLEPVVNVFVVVEILTPLNKIIDFRIEVLIRQFCQLRVVEGIFVQLLQLFLESGGINSCLLDRITLFID